MPRHRDRTRQLHRANPWLAGVCLLLAAALAAAGIWRWRSAHPPLPGAKVELPSYVTQDFLTVNPWSRPGTELTKISGIVIHYVGNPNTTAQANRDYFESLRAGTDGVYASAHFIVGLDGEVIQCIPLTEIAYASNSRNDDTIAIEVCHPDETGQFSPVTYNQVTELTAELCLQLGLDPETDVIRHYDVTGKDCPKYYVEHPEAWDAFRADTAAELRKLQALKAK
jgi:N-acetylmuramoyl-L-alanine amidase